MTIITPKYFTNTISIGNASATQDRQLLGNGNELLGMIGRYERELLVKLFGYDLYKEFTESLEADTNGVFKVKSTADQKWANLLTGTEYQLNGKTVVFRGLRFVDPGPQGGYLQSLIAYYVYCAYIDNEEVKHSGLTFTKEKAKNAMVVSGRGKYATAWNMFYKLACGEERNGERSLYQFLQDNNAEYPSWERSVEFEAKNRWGL